MTTTTTIRVGEIHCEGCENTIRTALGRLDGVRRVQPDHNTDEVRVGYDDGAISEDAIRAALSGIGFEPVA